MPFGRKCPHRTVSISAHATLRHAAWLMRGHGVSELLVTVSTAHGMQAVGTVTDRDLAIEALMGGLDQRDNHVMQLVDPRRRRMTPGRGIEEVHKRLGRECLAANADAA